MVLKNEKIKILTYNLKKGKKHIDSKILKKFFINLKLKAKKSIKNPQKIFLILLKTLKPILKFKKINWRWVYVDGLTDHQQIMLALRWLNIKKISQKEYQKALMAKKVYYKDLDKSKFSIKN